MSIESGFPKEILNQPEIKLLEAKDYGAFLKVVESAWSKKAPVTAPHDFTAITNAGISLGAFANDELVGISFNLIHPVDSCLWIHMLGVNQEYQNQGVGQSLMQTNIQLLQNNPLKDLIHSIQLTSDPLLAKNCALYFHCGMTVNHYELDAYAAEGRTIPSDRFIFEWQNGLKPSPTDSLNQSSQVLEKNTEININTNSQVILVETPLKLSHTDNLVVTDGIDWREFHRRCFNPLFNSGFIATDITRIRIENQEKAFLVCRNK